ncbi:MAG: hypothetical protein WAW96_08280, partial [Alphaproteobacteria bacterium]
KPQMKNAALLTLLVSLSACASASGPGQLAAAGSANAPTTEGALPTTATPTKLPDGSDGWLVGCNIGHDFKACESRAQNLCPKGFKTLDRKQQAARNAPGMQLETRASGNGGASFGEFRQIDPSAVERTMLIECAH